MMELDQVSRRGWAYVLAVITAGAALTALALPGISQTASQWPTFCLLSVVGIASQLIGVHASRHQSYHPTLVFLFAGLLLLHPALFALLVVTSHTAEWIKERVTGSPRLRPWYVQPCNIAMHIIAGWAGHWTFIAVNGLPLSVLIPSFILAATTAALIYVLVSHLMTGLLLICTRGVPWHESGVLSAGSLLTDLILLSLGYVTASLWRLRPLLVLPALSPLILMYRALMVPQLQREARTDGKTGLLNARYFNESLTAELERAIRYDRPMAVIMSDLDLLRNINNTYGHLAGDQVLAGIGRTILDTVGEFDTAARFGGEEFVILLPETEPEDALSFAEALRRNVDDSRFQVATSPEPVHVTMSLGVACFPQDASTLDELIHAADVAVYQAKLNGRNQVIGALETSHSIVLCHGPLPNRLREPFTPTFSRRGDRNALSPAPL